MVTVGAIARSTSAEAIRQLLGKENRAADD
jgi:hypothetical protein